MNKIHEAPRGTEKNLVKVVFDLEPSDWHSYAAETAWGEDCGGGKVRLQNVPFAVYGYSLDDIVFVEFRDGRSHVVGVCMRGGHSTYRLILSEGVALTGDKFERSWKPLEGLGCSFEVGHERLLAMDVPPEANIFEVYMFLEQGESSGVWNFEEAHCGHSLEKG
jgi:hypothetical protein